MIQFEIIIRHTSYIVYPKTSLAKRIVKEYAKTFQTFERVYQNGKMKTLPDKNFSAGNRNYFEYIFNISTLNNFVWDMRQQGIEQKNVELLVDKPTNLKSLKVSPRAGKNARDYQLQYLSRILAVGNPYRLVSLGTGKGKSLSEDSEIETPSGTVLIKDLKVNDEVIGPDEIPSTVTGVFPQGKEQTYTLETFNSKKVKTNESHLWEVYDVDNEQVLMTTLEIKNSLENTDLFLPNNYDKDFTQIKSVVKSDIVNTVCIEVDNERNLFLLNNGLYTHNTFIASRAIAKLDKHVAVVVLPKYIDKWVSDLTDLLNIDKGDILVIQGGKDLRKLMVNCKEEDFNTKFIIFSNRTISNYITTYEDCPDPSLFPYEITPLKLMEDLNIGTVLIDEIHQEFYSMFRTMLYFNVERLIALSATLTTKNKELENMYNIMFPGECWIDIIPDDKYTTVIPIAYEFTYAGNLKHEAPGGRGYSHVVFELFIMKKPHLLRAYLKMILHYIEKEYLNVKKKGQKFAVYAATVKMCTLITKAMNEDDRFSKLDVRRYVADDPYENVIEPDGRVSTIMSSGTAIDIPGLISVFQTVNIASPQANIQVMGRLRNIPGTETKFLYLWCTQIDKHKQYHFARKKTLAYKTKEFKHQQYEYKLG